MKTVRSNKFAKIAASVVLGLGVVAGANALDEEFQATLTLYTPLSIVEDQAMDFGESAVGLGDPILATDANNGYASFTVNGDVTRIATASVAETTIDMTTGDGIGSTKRIPVSGFSVGVGVFGGTNQLDFVGDGQVADVRVYASADQDAEDIAGVYTGTANFRVVYN